MKKRDVATTDETIAIYQRLTQVCVKTDEGFCSYKAPFDDEVVAKELGVSKHSVARVRNRSKDFGRLRVANGAGVSARLDAMSLQIRQLHDRLSRLENGGPGLPLGPPSLRQ